MAYDSIIRSVVRSTRGKQVMFDVWNEPDPHFDKPTDKGAFWGGTEEQFFETYARTAKIIREELGPDAMIVGPSGALHDPRRSGTWLYRVERIRRL